MDNKEKDNLSLVIKKPHTIILEQTPIPEITDDDCLLRVHSCGICGSDLHLINEGYTGPYYVDGPTVLGHEGSGTVVAVGKNVKHLKIGDRVCVEPAIPCGKCNKCRQGNYNHCPISNIQARGMPGFDGCLRRYMAHPADWLYKLPENVSFEEGVIVEPLSIAVHAAVRAEASIGQKVLVCGAGTMGLLSLLVAKAYGASEIYITDVVQQRLDLAKTLGADYVYLIDPKKTKDEDVVKDIHDKLGEDGADVTYECTGIEGSCRIGTYATRNGGKYMVIGRGPPEIKYPLLDISVREIDVLGVCRCRNTVPTALYLIESGKVNVKPLITHLFKLENATDAIRTMMDPKANPLKIILTM